MTKHDVRCPQCLSARTSPCKVMSLPTAIVLGVGTFGLGLLVTIPWYFLERRARYRDPYYHAGYYCGDCGHTWLLEFRQLVPRSV
jgi:DNA-directed RNA polymerase subunit RPC12/RpoP